MNTMAPERHLTQHPAVQWIAVSFGFLLAVAFAVQSASYRWLMSALCVVASIAVWVAGRRPGVRRLVALVSAGACVVAMTVVALGRPDVPAPTRDPTKSATASQTPDQVSPQIPKAAFAAQGTSCDMPASDNPGLPTKTSPQASPSDLPIEGAIGVANVTRGDDNYSPTVDAQYDDVLKFQVYYNNRLNDGTKIIRGLRVGIDLPHSQGETQRVKAKISWEGGSISDSTVVRMRSDMCLQPIEGSVVWRHNIAPVGAAPDYRDERLVDQAVLGGGDALDDVRPRYAYSATVTVLARVVVSGAEVVLRGTSEKTQHARSDVIVNPGKLIHCALSVRNAGNLPLHQLVARLLASPGWVGVPGSVTIRRNTSAETVADDVFVPQSSTIADDNGLNLGSLPVGSTVVVEFDLKVEPAVKSGSTYVAAATIVGLGLGQQESQVSIRVA